LQSIRTIMERKTASHVMMLWKYKPLNQGDALTIGGSKHQRGE
jgi:hypothetical protein